MTSQTLMEYYAAAEAEGNWLMRLSCQLKVPLAVVCDSDTLDAIWGSLSYIMVYVDSDDVYFATDGRDVAAIVKTLGKSVAVFQPRKYGVGDMVCYTQPERWFAVDVATGWPNWLPPGQLVSVRS